MVNFQGGSCHVHSPSSHLHHTSSWKLHFPVFLPSLHLHSLGDHLHLSLISMPIRTWIKAHTSQSLFFFFFSLVSNMDYLPALPTSEISLWYSSYLLVKLQQSSCDIPEIFLWNTNDLLVILQQNPVRYCLEHDTYLSIHPTLPKGVCFLYFSRSSHHHSPVRLVKRKETLLVSIHLLIILTVSLLTCLTVHTICQ